MNTFDSHNFHDVENKVTTIMHIYIVLNLFCGVSLCLELTTSKSNISLYILGVRDSIFLPFQGTLVSLLFRLCNLVTAIIEVWLIVNWILKYY